MALGISAVFMHCLLRELIIILLLKMHLCYESHL